MRVEAGGSPEFGRASARSGGARRRRRRGAPAAMAAPAAVQRLFEACREVFGGGGAGAVPLPAGVDRIKSILDCMTAADVGITPNASYFRNIGPRGAAARITYLCLYVCNAFSICIFCLPSRGVIPLHNHPGMTVFSKLLFGSMHIKSYDWADIPRGTNDVQLLGGRLAEVKVDGILTAPCETSILYPADGGNTHCFTAGISCAVLDVLGPPYNDGKGRHCQYYNAFSLASSRGDARLAPTGMGYAWLEERERPADLLVVGAPYIGPRILDH